MSYIQVNRCVYVHLGDLSSQVIGRISRVMWPQAYICHMSRCLFCPIAVFYDDWCRHQDSLQGIYIFNIHISG